MDHLSYPQDAAFPPVKVPYYGNYKYDRLGFAGYPERCGFDKTSFNSGDFSAVPSGDHNSFFQAWLFFGTIHELLGAELHDFIDHQKQIVTTACLPYWAAKWQQCLPRFSRSKRVAENERVNECLRVVRDMINILDSRKFRQEGRSHLSEEVGLSITVLGLTLEEVRAYRNRCSPVCFMKDQDSESMVVGGWLTSEFARKRLEAAGWCKSEVYRLETYMFSSGMLYCGSMQSFGRTIDHSRCSEHRCAAEDIDEENYQTAHAEGCKGCEHDGPIPSDLASVLIGNNFPVIGLTKSETTSKIRIRVLPHRKFMAYTAITHVWADGLGNPCGNTLPKCQILRLYHLIQSNNRTRATWMWMPSSLKTNTVYLWIGTLCVPIEKELRKNAISSMYNVYKMAETVLLLDRSLLSISADRPTEELCFRITASPWMRRAWTLQEGGLAKSLSVQFANKAIDARTAMDNLFKRTKGAESNNITLLESSRGIAYVQYSIDSKDPNQLNCAFTGLIHRSTSHPEDKQICFAIMMRCDMNRVMEAEGDFRTQRILQQLKYIPSSFLWHASLLPNPNNVIATLDIAGFRWAPKNIFLVTGGEAEDGLAISDRGLLVSAHGMVYFGRSHYMTERNPCIRDFTSGKWYILRWFLAEESLDGSVVKSDAPWSSLAVILKSFRSTVSPMQAGVVIRLNWDPSMPTTQELSNYIRRSDTISGQYTGRALFEEINQTDTNRLEQRKVAHEKMFSDAAEAIRRGKARLEDFPQVERQIITEGDNSFLMFEGEMRGSQQKWCVT